MRAARIACRLAAFVIAFSSFAAFPSAQSAVQMRVLSNPRPDLVSGGDVLVEVVVPGEITPSDVKLTLNGTDVTKVFRADPERRTLTGRVAGLISGSNTMTVSGSGVPETTLTVVNHPNAGPVFSGPHEQPFICESESFKLHSGQTLGPALDANCSVATRVDYAYRSQAGGGLRSLPDPAALPADVAMITTGAGRTIPYVVRIETGTINRAIYQIAMLHNPADEPAPDFATRPTGWNGRLIYTFGGGCIGGWYRQGSMTGGVEDDVMLRRGYAVASSTLNAFANNCAETLAAETMMMVREHFIEAYGVPTFTIGWGGSGGSYQQHYIADAWPGLLDGIMPTRSFPDVAFGTVPFITDARLLKRYFDRAAAMKYSPEQKRQITGFGNLATMASVDDGAGRIRATEHCPSVLPKELVYHPAGNRGGARCTVYDHGVNVYGRDPATGFARRPLDNVGVQYGLAALNRGVITGTQFLDLNENIGGYDLDGNFSRLRAVADPAAIQAAYRSRLMLDGGGGLATTPVIDYRAYRDDLPEGDVHIRYTSFSTRERLLKANGHADNHVMLTDDRRWGDSLRAPVLADALAQMDRWLTTLTEDPSSDAPIVKVRRARPADLVDACWTREENPQKIVERATYGSGRCEELYPAHSVPRGVAGGPVASDVIKCQLKPVSASDYRVGFTPKEMDRLKKIFPEGVCDWTKPGVGQQRPAGAALISSSVTPSN